MVKPFRGVAVGFGRSAVHYRLPLQPPPLPRRRRSAQGGLKALELVAEAAGDLAGPLREMFQHRSGDAVDLGDAVLRLPPTDPESSGELGAEVGVVESGEGALVHDQRTGIQRQPAAIAGRDPVGDNGVGVQLRVEGPAGVLTKQPHHDPLGVHRDYLAVAAHSGVGVGLDPGSTASTARSCASTTRRRSSGSAKANSSDTDLGAEKVAS